jgi:DNA-binding response OmpR family regulator
MRTGERRGGRLDWLRDLWHAWRNRREDDEYVSENLEALEGKKALVVEPDAKSFRVLNWKLNSLGCEIIHARNGVSGLSVVEGERPDVIFVDSLLPDVSAVEFFDSLPDQNVPVVFLGVLRNQWNELHKLGRNVACLPKPYDPMEAASEAGRILLDRRGRI